MLSSRQLFFDIITFAENQSEEPEIEEQRLLNVNSPVPAEADVSARGNAYGIYFEDQYKPVSNATFTFGVRVDRDEIAADGALPIDPAQQFADYEVAFNACIDAGTSPGTCAARARNTSFTALPDIRDYLATLGNSLGIDASIEDLAGDIQQQFFFSTLRRIDTIDIDNTNISPFFSVKWDPFSNGQMAFSASYRRYYNNIFLNIPAEEGFPPNTNVQFLLDPVEEGGAGVGTLPANRQTRSGVEPAPNLTAVDRNLRTPFNDEVIFAFEREIATETGLRVEYINRQFRDQFQDVDINRAPGDFGACDTVNGGLLAGSEPDGIIDDCAGRLVPVFRKVRSKMIRSRRGTAARKPTEFRTCTRRTRRSVRSSSWGTSTKPTTRPSSFRSTVVSTAAGRCKRPTRTLARKETARTTTRGSATTRA